MFRGLFFAIILIISYVMKSLIKFLIIKFTLLISLFFSSYSFSDNHNFYEILEQLQKDIKTLEKAVYSGSVNINDNQTNTDLSMNNNSEDVLTRHLLKLSEIENQFQVMTNKFEEINFKLDKLSNRLSKVQADNQLRFQNLETLTPNNDKNKKLTKKTKDNNEELLPGSSQPQDLGSISYKDTNSNESSQKTQSIETTSTIVTETFQAEQKILPKESAEKQYKFATSFLKVGDYSTAERAFREFVQTNPEHDLAGNAQYWYAETFRIRQLYTDAASAYLEGYQKYPKGDKAPINLLKLGVSMVQIGEKDQGCKMINGVEKQYPKANQSVIQKAKYESQKFECNNKNS
jgi:tol-pal system protein YbgF